MFAIKGRLKVVLLVVGFLAAGLGMYEAFRPQQAEAHCSTVGRVHDDYDWKTGTTKTATGNRETVEMNCSRCQKYPAKDHTRIEVEESSNGVFIYKHRWLWDSDWTHCHSHKYSISYPIWYTVWCNQSGGGG